MSREYLIVDHVTSRYVAKELFYCPGDASVVNLGLHFPISLALPSHFSLSWKIPVAFPSPNFSISSFQPPVPAKSTSVPRPRLKAIRSRLLDIAPSSLSIYPSSPFSFLPLVLFFFSPFVSIPSLRFCPPILRLSSTLFVVILVTPCVWHATSKLPKSSPSKRRILRCIGS